MRSKERSKGTIRSEYSAQTCSRLAIFFDNAYKAPR